MPELPLRSDQQQLSSWCLFVRPMRSTSFPSQHSLWQMMAKRVPQCAGCYGIAPHPS